MRILTLLALLTLTACSSMDVGINNVRVVDHRDTKWDPQPGQSLLDVIEPWDPALTAQARKHQ